MEAKHLFSMGVVDLEERDLLEEQEEQEEQGEQGEQGEQEELEELEKLGGQGEVHHNL